MKYTKLIFAGMFMALLCASSGWAELSSKAKKAEKLSAAGNYTEAMEIYKGLMAKNPQKDADLVKEGREGMAACLLLQAKDALAAKKFDDAKALCLTVVKEYKDAPSALEAANVLVAAQLGVSDELDGDGKYDDSVAQCKEVKALLAPGTAGIADLDRMIVNTYMKWGAELVKQQKHEEAQALYEKIATEFAASVDISALAKKNASQCAYALGVCFRTAKQPDKAIAAYRNVTEKYKDTPFASAAFADMYIIYMERNDRENALNAIKQATSLEPGNTDYLFKEVDLLADMGKTDEAQKYAVSLLSMLQEEAQRAYLNKDVWQYKVGKTQLILNNFPEATVEFEKALARNPSSLDAKRGLATAQFNDKNFAGALVTYDALLSQYAVVFTDADQKAASDKNSEELAKKVEDLRKEIAYFHFQKGLSLEQLGDYDKALSECRLGLEGVPTKEAAAALKRIQGQAGKKAETKPAEIKPVETKPVDAKPSENK
jgi:tetratricopeptide (TPR) repeat protein